MSKTSPVQRKKYSFQMVTTGATDGKIRIFDLRRRDCISSWTAASSSSSADGSSSAPASSSAVTTLHPSHDDTSVYTMTEDGVVSHWSLVQTGQKLSESHPIPSEYFSNKSAHPRSSLSSPVFAFTRYVNEFFSRQGGGAGASNFWKNSSIKHRDLQCFVCI